MLIYLLRRLLLAASVMLVAISLLFCLVFLVLGDPASVALGPRASEAKKQALRQNSWADRIIGVLSISVIARPAFVVAIYALLIFSVTLKWFPAIGTGHRGDMASQLHVLVLPSLTVALGWIGYLSRPVRAPMLEVLKENHICTFRAFGIHDRLIALCYARPIAIAIVPVVSVLGVGIGSLLFGAVLTEIVFARPGGSANWRSIR